MPTEFTRLECREILSHLSSTCDPDVVAKLIAAAEWKQQSNRIDGSFEPLQAALTDSQRSGSLAVIDDDEGVGAEAARRLLQPMVLSDKLNAAKIIAELERDGVTLSESDKAGIHARGWTQQDVDRVNEDHRIAAITAANIDASAPDAIYGKILQPQPVAGAGVQPNVPVGSKNQFGHVCIRLTEKGESVFRCGNDHGYIGNNQAIRGGCPQCFMRGDSGGGGESTGDRYEFEESF